MSLEPILPPQPPKKHALRFLPLLVLLTTVTALRAQSNNLAPTIPMGSLSAFPTIVQAGTHPTLTWNVVLPESVDYVIDIQSPGTIRPKRCLIMDVRVLGAAVKQVRTNPNGKIIGWDWVATQAQMNYNSQGYKQIFYNTHNKIKPNSIIYSQFVDTDSSITFGGRYVLPDGAWSAFQSSTNSTRVHTLKNGDLPPTSTPLRQLPTLESYLVPYLDPSTSRLKLGPRDVMVMMELTHLNPADSAYDLQDLVLLLTFYDRVATSNGTVTDCEGTTTITASNGSGGTSVVTVKNNNGHGNNVDGVDSSNPGNAPFTDTDPTIDDERGRRAQ